MKRLDGWYTSLANYVEIVRRTPFAYGEHDCALFAAGAVRAMTGDDPAADLRGSYSTLAGGMRKLKKLGFANHAEFAASLFAEVHPSEGQIGDIAAIPVSDGAFALGVVAGSHILIVQPDRAGLGVVELLAASRMFRIDLA